MTPVDLERMLRYQADDLRRAGVYAWDAQLRANGLDPLVPSWAKQERRGSPDVLRRAAPIAPSSYDADAGTIECTWTTGAGVQRSSFMDRPNTSGRLF